jgi:hypothetical protein
LGRSLADALFGALAEGRTIDLTIVDMRQSGDPLATTDVYITLVTKIYELNETEARIKKLYRALTASGAPEKASALQSWCNDLIRPLDEKMVELKRSREQMSTDDLEKSFQQLSEEMACVIKDMQEVFIKVSDRQRAAIAASEIEDLLV